VKKLENKNEHLKEKNNSYVQNDLKEIVSWYEKNKDTLPQNVQLFILVSINYLQTYSQNERKAREILSELRRQMGIEKKSEKLSSLLNSMDADTEEDENLTEEQRREKKELQLKIFKLLRKWSKFSPKKKLKKTQEKENGEKEGEGENKVTREEELISATETVFDDSSCHTEGKEKNIGVNREMEFKGEKGLRSSFETRIRYDVRLVMTKITNRVETVYSPTTGKRVTAKVTDGPENTQYTWDTVVSIIQFVVAYCIPMNRLAKMIGLNVFSSTKIWYILRNAAQAFLPIYLHLFEELAQTALLSGDDSPVRVLEQQPSLKEKIKEEFQEEGELSSKKKATEGKKTKISDLINEQLGFESSLAKKEGNKKQLNVTLMTGKSIATDHRSYIIFYRSHYGSLGNLFSKLLEYRSPKLANIILQSDLSSTNNPVIPKKKIPRMDSTSQFQQEEQKEEDLFKVTQAGCAAHARRPFARYWEQDPELCMRVLMHFNCLGNLEKAIEKYGLTKARVLRVRQKWSSKVWKSLFELCQKAAEKHSPNSKLGNAVRYITKHYAELTCYLNIPQVQFTNNLQERLLRYEALAEAGSKFRKTFIGRAVYDILRTVIATVTAAGVSLKEYIPFVMKNKEQAAQHPEKFTPYAFALLKKSETSQSKPG